LITSQADGHDTVANDLFLLVTVRIAPKMSIAVCEKIRISREKFDGELLWSTLVGGEEYDWAYTIEVVAKQHRKTWESLRSSNASGGTQDNGSQQQTAADSEQGMEDAPSSPWPTCHDSWPARRERHGNPVTDFVTKNGSS
jgi:hypothetical protein